MKGKYTLEELIYNGAIFKDRYGNNIYPGTCYFKIENDGWIRQIYCSKVNKNYQGQLSNGFGMKEMQ